MIKILRDIYNDADGILSWWIYEMVFGKSCKNDTMRDKNGHNIPIKTIDDLYQFYVKYTLL